MNSQNWLHSEFSGMLLTLKYQKLVEVNQPFLWRVAIFNFDSHLIFENTQSQSDVDIDFWSNFRTLHKFLGESLSTGNSFIVQVSKPGACFRMLVTKDAGNRRTWKENKGSQWRCHISTYFSSRHLAEIKLAFFNAKLESEIYLLKTRKALNTSCRGRTNG